MRDRFEDWRRSKYEQDSFHVVVIVPVSKRVTDVCADMQMSVEQYFHEHLGGDMSSLFLDVNRMKININDNDLNLGGSRNVDYHKRGWFSVMSDWSSVPMEFKLHEGGVKKRVNGVLVNIDLYDEHDQYHTFRYTGEMEVLSSFVDMCRESITSKVNEKELSFIGDYEGYMMLRGGE